MIPRPDLLADYSPPGIAVYQLTDEDVPACHVYMEARVFTLDNTKLVLHRSAHAHGSDQQDPEHRYLLCNLEHGGKLTPLTEEVGVTAPSVSYCGRWLYYLHDQSTLNGGRIAIKRVRLDGTGRETLRVLDSPFAETGTQLSFVYPLSTIRADDRCLVFCGFLGDGVKRPPDWGLVCYDIEADEARVILHGPQWSNMHPQYARTTEPGLMRDLLVQHNHGSVTEPDGTRTAGVGTPPGHAGLDLHVLRDDGQNLRDLPIGRNFTEYCQGHQCWRGGRPEVLATAGWVTTPMTGHRAEPFKATDWTPHQEHLLECRAQPHAGHKGRSMPDARVHDLTGNVDSPRLLHFATDASGDRLITDGWPMNDQGCELHLAILGEPMIAEPRWIPLLDTRTHFHTRRGHPHPFLSPDGRRAFFNSTETGRLQAYMVTGLERIEGWSLPQIPNASSESRI